VLTSAAVLSVGGGTCCASEMSRCTAASGAGGGGAVRRANAATPARPGRRHALLGAGQLLSHPSADELDASMTLQTRQAGSQTHDVGSSGELALLNANHLCNPNIS
jgi:hypothetical protein